MFCGCTARFVSDLVGNPNCWFSHAQAHFLNHQDNEPCREKTGLLPMQKQRGRSAKLISAFVFATWIVQFLLYLYPKFQDSNFLLWVYRPVCVGSGRKPQRPIFSRHGSHGSAGQYNFLFVYELFKKSFVFFCLK